MSKSNIYQHIPTFSFTKTNLRYLNNNNQNLRKFSKVYSPSTKSNEITKSQSNIITSISSDLLYINLKLKFKLLAHKVSYFNEILSNNHYTEPNEISKIKKEIEKSDDNLNYILTEYNPFNQRNIENIIKQSSKESENLSEIADNLVDCFDIGKNNIKNEPIKIKKNLTTQSFINKNKYKDNSYNKNFEFKEEGERIEIQINGNKNKTINVEDNNEKGKYQTVKIVEYNYTGKNKFSDIEKEKVEKNLENCQSFQKEILNNSYNIDNTDRNQSGNETIGSQEIKIININGPEDNQTINQLKKNNFSNELKSEINNESYIDNNINNINNKLTFKYFEDEKIEENNDKIIEDKITLKEDNKKNIELNEDDLSISSKKISLVPSLKKENKNSYISKSTLFPNLNIFENEKKKKNVTFNDNSLIKISFNENEKVTQLEVYDYNNKRINFNPTNIDRYLNLLNSGKPKSIFQSGSLISSNSSRNSIINHPTQFLNCIHSLSNSFSKLNESSENKIENINYINKNENVIKKQKKLRNKIPIRNIKKYNNTICKENNGSKIVNLKKNVNDNNKNINIQKAKEFSKKLNKNIHNNKSHEKNIKFDNNKINVKKTKNKNVKNNQIKK